MKFARYIMVMALICCGFSCGNEDAPLAPNETACSENNQLSLINGEATSDFKAVSRIVIREQSQSDSTKFSVKICSGTALAHNTFLTAFHCIPGSRLAGNVYHVPETEVDLEWTVAQQTSLLTNNRKALKIVLGEEPDVTFTDDGRAIIETESVFKDIAVLIFPNNTFSEFLPVGDRDPHACEFVDLVGFGETAIPAIAGPGSKSIKRTGKNQLPLIPSNLVLQSGSILVSGWAQENNSQNLTLASKGDSGGPMILGGAVVGLVSMGGLTNELSQNTQLNNHLSGDALNFYASLKTSNFVNLMKDVQEEGGSFQILELPLVN